MLIRRSARPRAGLIPFIAAALCFAAVAAPAAAESIWIEGEDASIQNVTEHGWYDDVRKDGMSGEQWISHYDASKPGLAAYRFDVEAGGTFTLWWRGNTNKSKVSWKLDNGAWQVMDQSDKRGEYQISESPDHRSLAWVKVGRIALEPGSHTVWFRFESEISNHGGIDALVFDNGNFVPSGTMKPQAQATGGTLEERPVGPDKAIWIEGEDPTSSDVAHHDWYDRVKKDGMSGEQWISHYHATRPGVATYTFDVEVGDSYTFWWRGNTSRSQVSWRLDGGDWRELDPSDKRGEYQISENPDHRSLAWVKVGRIDLEPGTHRLSFRFHSDISNHGGMDAFVLSRIPFVPSGARKPTEVVGGEAGPDEWFPVVFDDDRFSPESVIDMSHLVEAPAGQHGFLTADGADLRFQRSEEPVKFWGAGANLRPSPLNRERQAVRAKYLRKHGINMVRQHSVFGAIGPYNGGRFNPQRLDDFDWWFAELKQNGIYMTWSVFYPLLIGPDDGYPRELFEELPVRNQERNLRSTSGLVNFERELQDLQLRYVRALLNHRNPYTGLRYKDDPALAVVEVHNEDNVFFHSPLNDLRSQDALPLHSERVRQMWGAWVKEHYRSEAALRRAWGELRPRDSWAEGTFELMGAYHLGADGPLHEFAGRKQRAGDYIQFLTEVQREFYERRERELRSIGYKAVTVTTAWKAGGPAADPANLYSDTAMDMIDRHNYMGGGAGGHNIALGEVNNQSHMTNPGGGLLTIGRYQVEGKPFSCTEWTQLPPNQWKLEAAPLFAFYGLGLQGWDASYHFLNSRTRLGDGWPNLSSYVTDTPHYIGQFPALAFAIHHGHIEEGPTAVARRIEREDLFSGDDPLQQNLVASGYDRKQVEGPVATPSEALAIGKVLVSFEGGTSERIDLTEYWDRRDRTIRAATGQLTWDYGEGVVEVRSDRTQGLIGRAGGNRYALPGVDVEVDTPFVSLLFTPLDNQPLAASKHILITAMARDKQTGARYNEDGTALLALGAPPLLMEPVQATIRFEGEAPTEVNALDVYGVPTDRSVELDADGGFRIDGRYRTYYYEVKR